MVKKAFRQGVATLALSVLTLGTAAVSITSMTPDFAFAGPGNGKGNSGESSSNGKSEERGKSGERGNRGNNGRGAVASELKGLNAAHANAKAFENASPNSRVGQLAVYRDQAIAAQTEYEEYLTAFEEYEEYRDSYDGRSSADIQAEIDALDSAAADYEETKAPLDEELAAALEYETELRRLGEASNAAYDEYQAAAGEADAALEGATGGRLLSDEAMAELNRLLGL